MAEKQILENKECIIKMQSDITYIKDKIDDIHDDVQIVRKSKADKWVEKGILVLGGTVLTIIVTLIIALVNGVRL